MKRTINNRICLVFVILTDALGSATTPGGGVTDYRDGGASRLISVTQPNGETVSYTYDGRGNGTSYYNGSRDTSKVPSASLVARNAYDAPLISSLQQAAEYSQLARIRQRLQRPLWLLQEELFCP